MRIVFRSAFLQWMKKRLRRYVTISVCSLQCGRTTGNGATTFTPLKKRRYDLFRLCALDIGTFGSLTYVNREDDSGDPGLRTSKTKYHPVFMAHKYLVHSGSPAAQLAEIPTISSGGVVLTGIQERDKPAYLKLNMNIENNRYWGYDYREDVSITGQPDENTFYDSVMYDTAAGDSIDLAVRLSDDGEMIGETVLWNFTSHGTAELGCRILPDDPRRRLHAALRRR